MLEEFRGGEGRPEVTPYISEGSDGEKILTAQCPFCNETFFPIEPGEVLRCSKNKSEFYIGPEEEKAA